MKVCDLDEKTYLESKNKSEVSDYENDLIKRKIQKVKDSDIKMINKLNKNKYRNKKIKSNKAFDKIREAEKEKGAIIMVSINIENGGRCY